MPKRNIVDVRPGDIMLVEEECEAHPFEYSNPPRVMTVEKTVEFIYPLRSECLSELIGQVHRIQFTDGSSIDWTQPRCWVVKEIVDA